MTSKVNKSDFTNECVFSVGPYFWGFSPLFGGLKPLPLSKIFYQLKYLLFDLQHPKVGPTMAKLPKMWKIHEQVNEIVLMYYQ